MALLKEFSHTLARLDAAGSRTRTPRPVVLGVSGGPDSLAMLHLFARARGTLNVVPVAVHVDHQIRGEDARLDAAFVAETANAWGVPVRIVRVDVPALAAERRLSLEEAARQARYTALGQVAAQIGAYDVAVAHNLDDQAETVLMHLLRGAGLAGLRGMLPAAPLSDYHLLTPVERNVRIIRPLLGILRERIEAYCAAHGLQPRFDRSNLDTTFFRNRLRREIIPMLEQVNPNLRETLARTASVLAADYELLASDTDATLEAITLEASEDRVRFDLRGWRGLPLSTQRAAIRRAVLWLREGLRDVSYEPIEAAVEVARNGPTGAEATLPGGLRLRVGYDALDIAGEGRPTPRPGWPLLEPGSRVEVTAPGVTGLPGTGWRFELTIYDGPHSGPAWKRLLKDPWAAPLNAARLDAPLALRTREPGDRFAPMGVGGTKKVSDFMIDQKIPADWRDYVPLLVCGSEIVWVCGWRVDERYAVEPATARVWIARFVREGIEQAAR